MNNDKVIRIGKYIYIILGLCLTAVQHVGAQVKFYTLVSESTVSLRQTFQVQYIVEGADNVRQLTIPRFKDFETEDIFDVSNSTSSLSSSGGKQGLHSYSRIIVLLATKKGRFTIPGATAVINGKQMRSNAAQVVVQQSVPGMSNIDPDEINIEEESVLYAGDDITEKVKKNLFLRVESSKTTCYVGEPMMVVYKAYSRLNANSQVVKRPSLTGFSVMEMVDAYDGKPEIEKLNGRLYYTNLIRKVQLFPLQEGHFTLDAAEIESVIHFVRTNEPANTKEALKDMFRNRTPSAPAPVNYRTILRTEPLTITVKPLPEANQPPDFAGAVGQFALSVRVPSTTVHQGDLVKIQVSVTGSGNISLLTPPVIKWPAGVDTAEPSVKENINKYVFPLSGSKTFEYSFAAPDTGDYIIPAARLPYYDPVEKKYKIARSDSVILHVSPGLSNKDEQRGNTVTSGKPAIPRQLYWFALVATVIVACIVYQVVSLGKGKCTPAQRTGAPEKKEVPLSQKPAVEILAQARVALEQEQQQLFYHEVQQALWDVVADKYQVLPSQLNKYHIAELLAGKDVPTAAIQNFSSVLDECEWALYTPSIDKKDRMQLLLRAEQAITGLQKT